ncbi:MAG: hypothetical protein CMK59_09725 [Proteobacteria bacterium]|nr:hypothetical protein [Pseudomonadota bacterium]
MLNSPHITWNIFSELCLSLSLKRKPYDSFESELLSLIDSIDPTDTTVKTLFEELEKEPTVAYRTHLLIDEPTCRIMLVLLQKDGTIGLHNHPKQHGLIYCCRGSVFVEGFDLHEIQHKTAVLKRVFHSTLTVGHHTYLRPNHSNIHHLKGEETSWLLDIFIPKLQDQDRILCQRYELPHRELGENLCLARIIPPPPKTKSSS